MTDLLKTIFFDVGDTLIRVRSPLNVFYAQIIRDNKGEGFDEEAVKAAMKEQLENTGLVHEGHFRYSDGWFNLYIDGMLEKLGCPKPWDGIRAGLFRLFGDPDTFEVFPDVYPSLDAVRSAGFKMAVVSNWGYGLPQLLERIGLGSYFQIVIASADVEAEKPDPRIFELALQRTESLAEETLHIGDNQEADIIGAQAAGIYPVWLDRNQTDGSQNHRITTLADLLNHIDAI